MRGEARKVKLLKSMAGVFYRAGTQFFANNAQKQAAAISYYVLFSMIPLLIFITGMTGTILGEDSAARQDIIDEVTDGFPATDPEGRQEIEDAINDVHGTGGGGAGLIALVAAVWGASSMLGAIRYSLNIAFDDVESRRPFVPQKLLDLSLVLGLGVAFIGSVALSAAFRLLASTRKAVGGLADVADDLDLLFALVASFIPMLLAFLGFLAAYCLVPSRLRAPSRVWPGALVAALLFQAGSIGFAIYLERFGSYNVVFGALGAVAVFLFWVYLNAGIMLFGAEVAAEYPRARAEQVGMPGLSEPLPRAAWGVLRGLFVRQQPETAEADKTDEPPRLKD